MGNIKLQILDTTLREGEQTPGVSFKISQKIEIVKLMLRDFLKKVIMLFMNHME